MNIVKPLCAHRFKLGFNKAGNCTTLSNFAGELEGQWVWLIDATSGVNDPLYATEIDAEKEAQEELEALEEHEAYWLPHDHPEHPSNKSKGAA